ncbi:hypothetical protein EB118_17370, partial [bacterium]|nr:hypothetical protein [bacterium]
MTTTKFLPVKLTKDLLKVAGIRYITKGSIVSLENNYIDIAKIIHQKVLITQGDSPNVTHKTVKSALYQLREPILQSNMFIPVPCKPFKKRLKQFKSFADYKRAKINFYTALKSCTLVSHSKFVNVMNLHIDLDDYTDKALVILHKGIEQFFKRYFQLIVYRNPQTKAITSNLTEQAYSDFLTPISQQQNVTDTADKISTETLPIITADKVSSSSTKTGKEESSTEKSSTEKSSTEKTNLFSKYISPSVQSVEKSMPVPKIVSLPMNLNLTPTQFNLKTETDLELSTEKIDTEFTEPKLPSITRLDTLTETSLGEPTDRDTLEVSLGEPTD